MVPLIGLPAPPGLPSATLPSRSPLVACYFEQTETTFLSIFRSSARTAAVVLRDGACQVPSKPAHSVSTLSANRPEATSTTCRVYFTPTTLMSFNLQGLTSQRLQPVSKLLPSMPFLPPSELKDPRLRRFTPSAKQHLPTPVASRKKTPTLLAFPL